MIYSISEISSMCGKLPFEPRNKTLLIYWAKLDKQNCMKYLTENNVIEFSDKPTNNLNTLNNSVMEELNKVQIGENTNNLSELLNTATENYKTKEPSITDDKIELFKNIFSQKMNQKLGTKSEKTVVIEQKAKRPKRHVSYDLTPEITLTGICDCILDDGTIIEIKTRTKIENVRKNEYDLYQLFGYMLGYNAAKGKIVQRFQNNQWSSDIETENEYGIIDLDKIEWSSKLKKMVKEVKLFNNELFNLITKGEINPSLLNFIKKEELPICTIYNGKVINRNTKYNKLINYLF